MKEAELIRWDIDLKRLSSWQTMLNHKMRGYGDGPTFKLTRPVHRRLKVLCYNVTGDEMDIEAIARRHWWTRESPTALNTYAVGILLGADDERSAVATHRIDKAWETVKDVEVQAMKAALDG